MRSRNSIKIISAFFFIVFSLNTIAGVVCAVNIEFTKNNAASQPEEEITIHIHADGTKHEHKKPKAKVPDISTLFQFAKTENPVNEKNNCCSDKVVSLELTDKLRPSTTQNIAPDFLILFTNVFFTNNISYFTDVVIDRKYFVRSYHPPIADIRLAIRSFQI